MKAKRPLLIGATVATIAASGIGGVGLVSAATDSSTTGNSLVDKIAAKFNLKKSDVQAVFDEDRQAHEAEREAQMKETLATAVKDGKLTQAQSDHITSVMNEIKTLRGDTKPKDESDTVRSQIKQKMDDLRTWADQNNVDKQYIMFGHGPGVRGGPGGPGGLDKPADSSSSTSTSGSTTN